MHYLSKQQLATQLPYRYQSCSTLQKGSSFFFLNKLFCTGLVCYQRIFWFDSESTAPTNLTKLQLALKTRKEWYGIGELKTGLVFIVQSIR
jgi:hypothetical protein